MHLGTKTPIVCVDSGAYLPVQSIQGNASSIGHYPLSDNLDQSKNSTGETSIQAMTATFPANRADTLMKYASIKSNIDNQPVNDNHDTNVKTPTSMTTPENGNQIGEKGGSSSLSSNLKRKQWKEKTITATCVSNTKTSQPTNEESLITTGGVTDSSRISNKKIPST